jgi:hypothetical protein
MICSDLLAMTEWQCSPAGVRTILAVAPVTLGWDGRHAAFYVAKPTDDTFLLTDASETAMHASQSGIDVTKARLDLLNDTAGVRFAKFDDALAITASGPIENAEAALWDAVKLALSLSFVGDKWMPKIDHVRFRSLVEKVLVASVGKDRVKTGYKTPGISGHVAEFPFAIKAASDRICLIEPISLLDGKRLDWGRIHQVYGKLADVKQADDQSKRLVVFETGASDTEFGRAATLLAQTAEITTYPLLGDWSQRALGT